MTLGLKPPFSYYGHRPALGSSLDCGSHILPLIGDVKLALAGVRPEAFPYKRHRGWGGGGGQRAAKSEWLLYSFTQTLASPHWLL